MTRDLKDVLGKPPPSVRYLGLRAAMIGVDYVWSPLSDIAEHAHAELEVAAPLGHAAVMSQWRAVGGRAVSQLLHPGEVCIISSDQPHTMTWDQPTDVLWVHLDRALLTFAAHDLFVGEAPDVPGGFGIRDPFIAHLGATLRDACALGAPSRLYTESLGNVLAVHLLTRYATTPTKLRTPPDTAAGNRLGHALDYIAAHLQDDLSLHALAAEMHLSPYHFAHVFRRRIGQTPHQYVTAQRLARAKELLTGSDLAVAEICVRVGYPAQSHFIAVFRRAFGITPQRYRSLIRAR